MATEPVLSQLKKAGVKINKNHARDLIELVAEIAGRDGLSPEQVLSAPDIEPLLRDGPDNGPQRLGRLKAALWKKRYPTVARVKQAFEAELKRLNLGPGIKVTPTPYFEDSNLTIELGVRAPADSEATKAALKRLAETDIVKNALQAAENNN